MTGRPRSSSRNRLRAVVAVMLCVPLLVAGCSSSKPAASTTSSSAGQAGGTVDPATKAAITKAYLTFFNPKSPEPESLASLQHGPLFKAAIDKEAKSSLAGSASVKISNIKLLSPKVAVVTFTIYEGTQAVLPNTAGKAVLDGGKWKLAAETFCSLLKLEGDAPAVCNDPKITALP